MRFCSYCGQPLDPVTQECPLCGGYKTNDFSQKFSDSLKSTLRSPLMLILCIVLTSSVLFSLADTEYFFVQCLGLIIPIALWITYFSACSSKTEMSLGGIRMVSICITIIRVLVWIILAVVLVFSIIIIAVPTLLGDYLTSFSYLLGDFSLLVDFGAELFLFVGIALLIISVLAAIINISFLGCIGKSIKSIIESFKYNENRLEKFKGVKVWLIIIGIFYAVYAIYTFSISGILSLLAIFLGAFLAGKVGKTDII